MANKTDECTTEILDAVRTQEYLDKVSDELNSKCTSFEKSKKDSDIKPQIWNQYWSDDLSFNISDCRNYCMKVDMHYCNEYDYVLCDSCRNILEERIRKPFNKTPDELEIEKQTMKTKLNESNDLLKKIDILISYIDKLEMRISSLEQK